MTSWEVIHRASVFAAEEMGVALKRSAFSPNIRERMDHSCAIVSSDGQIVAQAEHIPVHLGSFRVGVRSLLDYIESERLDIFEGDMVITNDPYISGTHLNDIMILAPVFYEGKIVAFVINKAHHVDVGGAVPGSMNPGAESLYDEGLIVPPTKIIKSQKTDKEIIDILLANFKTPEINRGDLNAQLASNLLGIRRVGELFREHGYSDIVRAWAQSITYAKKLSSQEIRSWPSGKYSAIDQMEWKGQLKELCVSLVVEEDKVKLDFEGTCEQLDGPLNAVFGVTYSASAFAVRCALANDVPTNEGFYSLVDVIVPPNTMLNPTHPAPVAAGNVETSQRIADVVLRALAKVLPAKLPAASSGTMMNVILGGRRKSGGKFWAYYETIGGGSGARPAEDGISGVQVNMTNTLNTPLEIAERAYPIEFTEYRLRRGSGGKGKFKGGDGIKRSFRATSKCDFTILSDRFLTRPWGLKGGEEGSSGSVIIHRHNSKEEIMPSKFSTKLDPEDEVRIETPGGGGWGSPES